MNQKEQNKTIRKRVKSKWSTVVWITSSSSSSSSPLLSKSARKESARVAIFNINVLFPNLQSEEIAIWEGSARSLNKNKSRGLNLKVWQVDDIWGWSTRDSASTGPSWSRHLPVYKNQNFDGPTPSRRSRKFPQILNLCSHRLFKAPGSKEEVRVWSHSKEQPRALFIDRQTHGNTYTFARQLLNWLDCIGDVVFWNYRASLWKGKEIEHLSVCADWICVLNGYLLSGWLSIDTRPNEYDTTNGDSDKNQFIQLVGCICVQCIHRPPLHARSTYKKARSVTNLSKLFIWCIPMHSCSHSIENVPPKHHSYICCWARLPSTKKISWRKTSVV